MQIDLNADLAEGFGPWRMADDEALLDLVSSANIACGYHAGDPSTMERAVKAALARGVEIGAHVGFPDLQGFGRRRIQIETGELAAMVVYQLGALDGVARACGHRMTHMSFHGALGNMAAADEALARPLIEAVARFDPNILIVSSTSAAIEGAAAACGLRVATTFLADRAYDSAGLLAPRGTPGAVIHDASAVLVRVRRLLREGVVETIDGAVIPMPAQSILLHGDTEGSVALARDIRAAIKAEGGAIRPVSTLVAKQA